MRRIATVSLCVLACALAVSAPGGAQGAASHPCRLISDTETARLVGARAYVETGGSACNIWLRGMPRVIGVITINPDTSGRFGAFRRKVAASGQTVTDIPGLGQTAYLIAGRDRQHMAPHSVMVLQRGHRLVVTAYATLRRSVDPFSGDEVYTMGPPPLTRAKAKRIAALIAPRI